MKSDARFALALALVLLAYVLQSFTGTIVKPVVDLLFILLFLLVLIDPRWPKLGIAAGLVAVPVLQEGGQLLLAWLANGHSVRREGLSDPDADAKPQLVVTNRVTTVVLRNIRLPQPRSRATLGTTSPATG